MTPTERKERLGVAFGLRRVICRLIAAWSLYISTTLVARPDFATLSFHQTGSLWVPALWIAAFFVLFSTVAVLLPRWPTDSWFLFVGATACTVWWSLFPPDGNGQVLFWLALGTVYGMFLLWIVHENEATLSLFVPGGRTVLLLGIALAVVAGGVLAAIACLRYKSFSAPNFDFGLFVNMFHNMKETGLPLTTCERDGLLSHFAVHISPVWYLLLPVYCLFPSPYTLQIAQTVLLMAGVIPIVLLAKERGLSGRASLVLSALYVFYTALSTGCFYDIHENCFLPLLLLLTFLFFEKGKPVPMYIAALLTLSVKEDAAVYLAVFALFVFLGRKKYLHGTVLLGLSVLYFLTAGFLLETYGLGMMNYRYENLIFNPEDGLWGIFRTVFLNPGYLFTQLFSTGGDTFDKLLYFLQLLLPLGFLPFCTKKASRWILLSPMLLNLLTMYTYQYNIEYQYSFGITAFLFYAAILNVGELPGKARRSLLTVALSFCVCLYAVTVLPTLAGYVQRCRENGEDYARMEAVLDSIPVDASVACSTFLLSHIADRSEIYEVRYHEGKADIDYVILDLRYASFPAEEEEYRAQGYREVCREDGLILVLARPE